MTHVAQTNDIMFQAAMDAKYPELILWVSMAHLCQKTRNNHLEDECSKAFMLYSGHMVDRGFAEDGSSVDISSNSKSLTSVRNLITQQHLWPAVEGQLLAMHTRAMLNNMPNYSGQGPRGSAWLEVFWYFDSVASGYECQL
ncbi:hypothetical protein R3P38DRAFT_3211603 [Favolaschia claudopus]|uniref:Uncharacterized protein n=1 Tax=Favolaschia claudopus TaxID=2862362 RepID=A0AAW0AGH3_9AGAR